MSGELALSPKESLVERAMACVRDHIRTNGLKVGDTLPGEGQFAARLGVSRAVMREAFGALAALRQIDVGNGRKARVGGLDGSVIGSSLDHAIATEQVSVFDVWDVRRTLELRTVSLAAKNRSEEEAREIVSIARAMAACVDDQERLSELDVRFHQTIARASGNPLFHQIVRSFERLMELAVPKAWSTRQADEDKARILDWHLEVAQAIARGDAAAAETAMDRHFDSSVGDLMRSA